MDFICSQEHGRVSLQLFPFNEVEPSLLLAQQGLKSGKILDSRPGMDFRTAKGLAERLGPAVQRAGSKVDGSWV